MGTTRKAVTLPSDVNVPDERNLDDDRSRESAGRGPRADGSSQIPDRQLDIRDV